MNKFDFTQLGGFPFTQQTLADMHQNFADTQKWMSLVNTSYTDVILSGIEVSGPNVTSGWVSINGEILPFIGGTGSLGSYAKIVENKTSLNFDGGIPKDVKITRAFQLSAPGGGAIQLSQLPRFHEFIGARAAGSYQSTTITNVGAGQCSGTIYYRINRLTRLLEMKADLTVSAAQSIADPAQYSVIASFPQAWFWLEDSVVPFTLQHRYHLSVLNNPTTGTFTTVNGELRQDIPNSQTNLVIGFVKPQVGVSSYSVSFRLAAHVEI